MLARLHATAALAALVATASGQTVSLGSFTTTGSVPTGLLPSGSATEISGLVASRHHPGLLWVHDDSGNAAQLIALRSNGTLARQFSLSGTTNRDWEDLAIGPGPILGRDYLYLAETGNNALGYTSFSVQRLPEPEVPPGTGPAITLPPPDVFRFRYPSGTWNTETLWIDPLDGAPWVLTKENASTCSLFRYPLPLDPTVEKVLVLEATLTGMPTLFTGGAISADGRWIFARTTTWICAWSRPPGTTFAQAMTATPVQFATGSQGQAEAIAVAADGSALWAISEGAGAPIRRAPLTWPAGAPTWQTFGTGLGGAAGVPGLGATAAPRLGSQFGLGAWQLPPAAPGLFVISPTGFDDGQAPWQGGWLHAAPDLLAPFGATAEGSCSLAVPPLPDSPVFHGLPMHVQAITVDPTAAQGYGLSAGLRLVLDR